MHCSSKKTEKRQEIVSASSLTGSPNSVEVRRTLNYMRMYENKQNTS